MQRKLFVLDAIKSNRRRIALGVLVFFLVTLVELTVISLIAFYGRAFELKRFLYIMLLALGITAVLVPLFYVVGHFASRWAILRAFGTLRVSPPERRKINTALEGVCLAAGVSPPEVMVIDMDGINAISLARGYENGLILITPQAVLELDRMELEALLAHEVYHIAAHDTWLWMFGFAITAFLPFVLGIFAALGQAVLEDSSDETHPDSLLVEMALPDSRSGGWTMLVLGGIFFFIGYVVLAVFWVPLLVAFFLLVLPRDREYLADAQAVLLTRYPESVVALLEKAGESRSRGLKHGGFFINHMLFNQPQKKLVGFSSVPADLFDIHPPESARITRVEAMG